MTLPPELGCKILSSTHGDYNIYVTRPEPTMTGPAGHAFFSGSCSSVTRSDYATQRSFLMVHHRQRDRGRILWKNRVIVVPRIYLTNSCVPFHFQGHLNT